MKRAAAVLIMLVPTLALAQAVPHPAAQCAAFWLGRDDFAQRSTTLDRNPADLASADAARALAVRQAGGDEDLIDAFIAEQRPLMAFLMEAVIFGADEQSRDIHDRLATECGDFASSDALAPAPE